VKWLLSIWLFLLFSVCYSQDSIEAKKKWEINGYIKNLENISFDHKFKNSTSGNLLHNRIKIKRQASETFSMVVHFRNRLSWGEEVRMIPGFSSRLRNENEQVNMSVTWINRPALVLHTNTERLYAEYRKVKWNARIGRQRINWGISTSWNPNDLFNTFNFLDFDYEERSGVDACKFQYMVNEFSNVEIAYAFNGSKNKNTAAVKYLFNKWNYDVQLITGLYNEHLTLGAGWAGNIKDAGFKGEAQYFFANSDSADHLNFSIEGDYVFKKGVYVNISLLFNNHGLNRSVSNWNSINLKLSPENLMPTKWNLMVTTSKELTPLLSANMSVLYSPGTNLLILFPSMRYNIAPNLDADLVWQSFFAEMNSRFEDVNHRAFLRLRWSF